MRLFAIALYIAAFKLTLTPAISAPTAVHPACVASMAQSQASVGQADELSRSGLGFQEVLEGYVLDAENIIQACRPSVLGIEAQCAIMAEGFSGALGNMISLTTGPERATVRRLNETLSQQAKVLETCQNADSAEPALREFRNSIEIYRNLIAIEDSYASKITAAITQLNTIVAQSESRLELPENKILTEGHDIPTIIERMAKLIGTARHGSKSGDTETLLNGNLQSTLTFDEGTGVLSVVRHLKHHKPSEESPNITVRQREVRALEANISEISLEPILSIRPMVSWSYRNSPPTSKYVKEGYLLRLVCADTECARPRSETDAPTSRMAVPFNAFEDAEAFATDFLRLKAYHQ